MSAPPVFDFLEPPLRPGDLGSLGPVRILGPLGWGGMGGVFRAVDPNLPRVVAIKVMDPDMATRSGTAVERFLREARAMARIRHDHVVEIYTVGQVRIPCAAAGTGRLRHLWKFLPWAGLSLPFLTMQLLQGETLQDRLKRPGPLPPVQVIRLAREIGSALDAIHQEGLVHRDVKPANTWLEEGTDRVKVLDFGLVRSADDSHLTDTGKIVGTPAYWAPEQARGEEVDWRCDLYSLGRVLYQCATGRLPPHSRCPVPPAALVPAVPHWLSDLILRLLAYAPADRPPSTSALIRELQGNLEALGVDEEEIRTQAALLDYDRNVSIRSYACQDLARALQRAGF